MKSSEGDKDGPWADTLTNPDLPRSGTSIFSGSGGHVTGITGSSPLEAMPPIMIYKTKSKTLEIVVDTQISAQTKRSMDCGQDLVYSNYSFLEISFPQLGAKIQVGRGLLDGRSHLHKDQ